MTTTITDGDANRVVVAFTMPNPTDVHAIGVAVAFYDCPTVIVEMQGGAQFAWAQHLARLATPDEEIAYWKERALAAEQSLKP